MSHILLALAPRLRDLATGALAGVLQHSGERLTDDRHIADASPADSNRAGSRRRRR